MYWNDQKKISKPYWSSFIISYNQKFKVYKVHLLYEHLRQKSNIIITSIRLKYSNQRASQTAQLWSELDVHVHVSLDHGRDYKWNVSQKTFI